MKLLFLNLMALCDIFPFMIAVYFYKILFMEIELNTDI